MAQFAPIANLTARAGESGSTASPKLVKSAREFEAILLQSWLEKMNQSFAGLEQSQDAAHDTVSSLGTQAIAGALAARGGVGIANMILRQLEARQSLEIGDEGAATGQATAGNSGPEHPVTGLPQEKYGHTLKSSHKVPIIDLQAVTGSEVRR